MGNALSFVQQARIIGEIIELVHKSAEKRTTKNLISSLPSEEEIMAAAKGQVELKPKHVKEIREAVIGQLNDHTYLARSHLPEALKDNLQRTVQRIQTGDKRRGKRTIVIPQDVARRAPSSTMTVEESRARKRYRAIRRNIALLKEIERGATPEKKVATSLRKMLEGKLPTSIREKVMAAYFKKRNNREIFTRIIERENERGNRRAKQGRTRLDIAYNRKRPRQ